MIHEPVDPEDECCEECLAWATGANVVSQHGQCEDCGKCRVAENEEWCDSCKYWSCERQEDCKDEARNPYRSANAE